MALQESAKIALPAYVRVRQNSNMTNTLAYLLWASLRRTKTFVTMKQKYQFIPNRFKSYIKKPDKVVLCVLTKIALPANVKVGQNFQIGPTL